eukprot:TRINITY_DN8086_c0_g1_i1.p1 TRINITY_DN8086_c0_g1~~TRINITY_DN8086_c0_g1_i1.p1  ORF type:complete len:336 (-),score=71.82 TRINITY_DN8086_c0_g1_i1:243-1166(-)
MSKAKLELAGEVTRRVSEGLSQKLSASEKTEKGKEKELKKDTTKKAKTKLLIFAIRGISSRHRFLLKDIRALLPHHKREPKLDRKQGISIANEIAELRGCTHCLFFEALARPKTREGELFMWASATPQGPSVRFQVTNIHTMSELKLTGNCLKGSRGIVNFNSEFDSSPHLQVCKEILAQTFMVPKGSLKIKPFIDHIISFYAIDGVIWFRVYQIVLKPDGKNEPTPELVEIGPRFVLHPVRIFSSSFKGAVLYESPTYLTVTQTRILKRRERELRQIQKGKTKKEQRFKEKNIFIPSTPLDEAFDK